MKLRSRLLLSTVAAAAPPLLLLVAFDGVARHDAAEARLLELVEHRLDRPGSRQDCAADPARWAEDQEQPPRWGREGRGHRGRGRGEARGEGPGPAEAHGSPPAIYVYDADRVLLNPPGPALPAEPALEAGTGAVLEDPWYSARIRVVARPGGEPCAWVLAEGSTAPGWLGAILPPTYVWLIPTLAVLATVVLAASPTVRRIRLLTEAVRRAPAGAFEPPPPADDEIGELGAAFAEAHRAQRAQEQALRDFLANTTHDVMIPLTVLQGHLAALREGRAEALTGAMTEAQYIASLLRNLAVVARLDAARPRLERGPVELGALVDRVVARHRPVALQREIALEGGTPGEPVQVEGDVTLLEQALGNLVHNAVRHNRPGGHVAVLLEAGAGRFRLRVIDDGPGIPADRVDQLLQRGFRGEEARSRAPGGSGLGLDISRRVAELHGFGLALRPSEHGGLEAELEGPISG